MVVFLKLLCTINRLHVARFYNYLFPTIISFEIHHLISSLKVSIKEICCLTFGIPTVQHGWSLPSEAILFSETLMAFHMEAKLAKIRGKILNKFLRASRTGGTKLVISLAGLGSCKHSKILCFQFWWVWFFLNIRNSVKWLHK